MGRLEAVGEHGNASRTLDPGPDGLHGHRAYTPPSPEVTVCGAHFGLGVTYPTRLNCSRGVTIAGVYDPRMDLAVIRTLSLWQQRLADPGPITLDANDATELVEALATAVASERAARASIVELRAEVQRLESSHTRYRTGL